MTQSTLEDQVLDQWMEAALLHIHPYEESVSTAQLPTL